MACKPPVSGSTDTATVSTYGCSPQLLSQSPFTGAIAHTVLTAYRADAKTYLRIQRAEQCRKRLSPSVFVLVELLKELLQRQSHRIYAHAASDLF